MSTVTTSDDLTREVAQLWAPVPGYLNAATLGLPPRAVVDAMQQALLGWQSGEGCPVKYGDLVERARGQYAELVGVPAGSVAVGSQSSVHAGTVATSLPDGAEVLCVDGDFTSIVFPFLAQQPRISVRQVPLTELAEAITAATHLVVFSLAQSSTGELADVAEITEAAARRGALTFCDVTQAAGWFPVDAGLFDLTVCSAYKWLCQPRGTAYLTVQPEVAERLTPNNAGWYAGASVWDSCYGPEMHLASDARRFDVSPAWLCWVGAVAAGAVFAELDIERVRDHDLRLANAFRARLGQQAAAHPMVTVDDADGSRAARLEGAGVRCASRAGRVRLAFHLWNTDADVDRVTGALI